MLTHHVSTGKTIIKNSTDIQKNSMKKHLIVNKRRRIGHGIHVIEILGLYFII